MLPAMFRGRMIGYCPAGNCARGPDVADQGADCCPPTRATRIYTAEPRLGGALCGDEIAGYRGGIQGTGKGIATHGFRGVRLSGDGR